MARLFDPLKRRDLVLGSRIGMTPMCQYSARDGMAVDWYFVHYGSRAVGRAAPTGSTARRGGGIQ